MQVPCRHRLLLRHFSVGITDHDSREPFLKVLDAGCQAQNCHDLGSYRNVIAVFSRSSVRFSAKTVNDEPELSVVHVDASSPGNLARIDVQLISLIDVIIDHGCQQIVRGSDRMEIAGEVEIDVFHGNDLRVSAAGSTALHSEDRAEGRLTKSDTDLFPDL